MLERMTQLTWLLFYSMNPRLKSKIGVLRGILFRQLKTVKHSEAVYNETKTQPNTFSTLIPLLFN